VGLRQDHAGQDLSCLGGADRLVDLVQGEAAAEDRAGVDLARSSSAAKRGTSRRRKLPPVCELSRRRAKIAKSMAGIVTSEVGVSTPVATIVPPERVIRTAWRIASVLPAASNA
jgi:hypothetical protein